MSAIAGNLLVVRKRLTLVEGSNDIDTGIKVASLAYEDGQPILGISSETPPAAGATPASRVMVVPMAPTGEWTGITHSEPYVNPTTGTVHVDMVGIEGGNTINVMFWAPHTNAGPVSADTYNPAEE